MAKRTAPAPPEKAAGLEERLRAFSDDCAFLASHIGRLAKVTTEGIWLEDRHSLALRIVNCNQLVQSLQDRLPPLRLQFASGFVELRRGSQESAATVGEVKAASYHACMVAYSRVSIRRLGRVLWSAISAMGHYVPAWREFPGVANIEPILYSNAEPFLDWAEQERRLDIAEVAIHLQWELSQALRILPRESDHGSQQTATENGSAWPDGIFEAYFREQREAEELGDPRPTYGEFLREWNKSQEDVGNHVPMIRENAFKAAALRRRPSPQKRTAAHGKKSRK